MSSQIDDLAKKHSSFSPAKQALLEKRLRGSVAGTSASQLPTIKPDPEQWHMPFPLTDVQQAYWIGRSGAFKLGGVATHVYQEFESADLDLARLNRAWQRLIERHGMLRAIVLPDGQQQILERVPPYQIEIIDLRGEEPEAAAAQLEAVRRSMSHQVMQTDRWPLFEIRAAYLNGGRTLLQISSDALIGDAGSWQILMRELNELCQNPEAQLMPLNLSFRDYVLAEIALRDSELYRRSMQYWLSRLPTLPPAPELPLATDPRSLTRPRFVRLSARLESSPWMELKKLARQEGLTSSGLLLAAFAEVLAAWSKSRRFTINLTLFNRLPLHPEVNDIVGDFTSLSLLAVEHSSEESFRARARRIQEQLWDDMDHRWVSGVQVLRDLARSQGAVQGTGMPIVFTSTLLPGRSEQEMPSVGPLGEMVYGISQTPQVWLDHQVYEQGGTLVFNWDAVEELFPAGMLQEMFDAYCRVLHRLVEEPESWRQTTLIPSESLTSYQVIASVEPFNNPPPISDGATRREADDPALPAPDSLQVSGVEGTAITSQITQIIADVLKVESIDPDADLMSYGVNSLHIVRIANALEKTYGFRPEITRLFESPTVSAVAAYYEERLQAGQSADGKEQSAKQESDSSSSARMILDPLAREEFKKQQHGLRRDGADKSRISLPTPGEDDALRKLYAERRSHRRFMLQPIAAEEFAGFLSSLRQFSLDGQPKYLYASAGALYPVQVYLHIKAGRVEGLAAGTYYYQPVEHQLIALSTDVEIDRTIHEPFVNRSIFDEAAFSIFLIAQLAAIAPMYGELSMHFATLEAGYLSQLLMSTAPARGLGLCPVGTLNFDSIRHLFELEESHVLIHSLLGGRVDTHQVERWSSSEGAQYRPDTIEDESEEGEL
ncbi:MAG TPA: condensation domain-containing protein [Pyrinomonadaceae bacterium]|jgi:SagB-type dehydrogenase family enzyme